MSNSSTVVCSLSLLFDWIFPYGNEPWADEDICEICPLSPCLLYSFFLPEDKFPGDDMSAFVKSISIGPNLRHMTS